MELIIGLIVLAILVFIFLRAQSVFGNLLDALRVLAKRHLFMKSKYAEGQKLVSSQIVFHSNFDIDDIRERILTQIQPADSFPVLKPGFVIERSSDDLVIIVCGNKLQTFFKGALTLTQTDIGVDGSWTIISWLRHDEMVAARECMKQVVRHIHTGVTNVDPGATFGIIPVHRSPRIVEDYDFQDNIQVDYVQDFEAGLPAVS